MEEKDRRRLYQIRRFMGYSLLAFSCFIFCMTTIWTVRIVIEDMPLVTFLYPGIFFVFCAFSIPLVKQFLDPKRVGL